MSASVRDFEPEFSGRTAPNPSRMTRDSGCEYRYVKHGPSNDSISVFGSRCADHP